MLPHFETIMLPWLESLKEGKEVSATQLHEALAVYFELTDEELNERVQGSELTVFSQRIHEAIAHLRKADLLTASNEDGIVITPLGKQILHRRLNSMDTHYLKRFPGYAGG
jgi:restriction system protein